MPADMGGMPICGAMGMISVLVFTAAFVVQIAVYARMEDVDVLFNEASCVGDADEPAGESIEITLSELLLKKGVDEQEKFCVEQCFASAPATSSPVAHPESTQLPAMRSMISVLSM